MKWFWIICSSSSGSSRRCSRTNTSRSRMAHLPTWVPGNEHGKTYSNGKPVRGKESKRGYLCVIIAIAAFVGAGWMIYKDRMAGTPSGGSTGTAAPDPPSRPVRPGRPQEDGRCRRVVADRSGAVTFQLVERCMRSSAAVASWTWRAPPRARRRGGRSRPGSRRAAGARARRCRPGAARAGRPGAGPPPRPRGPGARRRGAGGGWPAAPPATANRMPGARRRRGRGPRAGRPASRPAPGVLGQVAVPGPLVGQVGSRRRPPPPSRPRTRPRGRTGRGVEPPASGARTAVGSSTRAA